MRSETRTRLRAATAPSHDEVDGIFTQFDLTSRAGYRTFLTAHARALLPIEAWLDHHAVQAITDWPARRRGHFLRADLAALGETHSVAPTFENPTDPAAVIGVLYVIEGSRLGGRVLARGVPDDLPTSYLNPPTEGSNWAALLQRLDELITDEAAMDSVTASALWAFAQFAAAGRSVAVGCPA